MGTEDLAAQLAKKKKPADAEDTRAEDSSGGDDAPQNDMSSYDDVEGSAADELASLANVKDKAAFKAALADYVQACVKKAQSS